jgi:tetratricopeptide (TPR) repeat protein
MTMRFIALLACALLALAQNAPVETAWDLLAKGKRNEAVAVLRQTLKAKPRDGEARLLLGSILSEDGAAAEAIEHLTEAVRLMPRYAMAHNALGEALIAAGHNAPARAAFEKAVALDPKFAQAQENLGKVLLDTGEYAPAAEHLDRALASFGSSPDAAYSLYLRAKIYTQREEHGKALAALKQSVSLQPNFPEAWSDLGQANKTLLDDAGAFAAFQRSVQLNPDNAVSQYRLGAEYLRQGKAHEAVPHLQASFRLNPKNQSTLYSLQMALRQDGQLEEAARVKTQLAELLRNIDKESQDAFAALRLNNEGATLEKQGDLPGALEKYRKGSTLDPNHIGIRVNFGVALLRTGQWSEGLSELREALRREPANAKVKAALDDALEQAPIEFGGKGKKSGGESPRRR